VNKRAPILLLFLALALAGCAGITSATIAPTAATHATVNTATLGGTVAAFKVAYKVDPTCHMDKLCFCASDGDTACDYLLGVIPATGRVTEVDLQARGNWPLDMTLTWCIQFLPSGASITSMQSGITASGIYLYSSDQGQVRMQIAPGSCELTFA
jgi:hypothetical protein